MLQRYRIIQLFNSTRSNLRKKMENIIQIFIYLIAITIPFKMVALMKNRRLILEPSNIKNDILGTKKESIHKHNS